MTVFANGTINFVDIGSETPAFLTVGENIAVTFMEGSGITTPAGTEKAMLEADESSSILDPVGIFNGAVIFKQNFEANTAKLISPPVSAAISNLFDNASELGSWREPLSKWTSFGFISYGRKKNIRFF